MSQKRKLLTVILGFLILIQGQGFHAESAQKYLQSEELDPLSNIQLTKREINVQKVSIDSSPSDFIWCGQDNHVVFILSDQNTIYRSKDYGLNPTDINSIFNGLGGQEPEASNVKVSF